MNKRNSVIIAAILLLLIGTGSFVFANPSEEEFDGTNNNQIKDNNSSTNSSTNNGSTSTNQGNSSSNNNASNSNNENNSVILEPPTNNNTNNGNNNSYISDTNTNNFNSGSTTTPSRPNVPITPSEPENPTKPTEPTTPSEPENPSKPTEPTTPSEPENPSKPTEPTTPSEPEKPSKPTEPTTPSEPENPSKPTDPTTPTEPDEEELIKEATDLVNKATETKKQEDIDAALDVVNKIKDENKKQELLDKLKEVQEIVDIRGLVQKASDSLANATNKDDIKKVSDFITEEDIINRINSIKDENEKNELTEKMEEILNIVNDIEGPILNGLPDKNITNKTVSITIEDKTNVTIYLNEKEVSKDDLLNLEQEGIYHIIVVDEAFNQTEITFTIDKTAPKASLKYSTTTLTKDDVIVTIYSDENIIITNNDGLNTYTFKENGSFTFEFTDEAGNSSTIEAIVDYIDKTAPVYKNLGIVNKTKYDKGLDHKIANPDDEIVVFVTFEEELNILPTITINEQEQVAVLNTLYSKDGIYVYTASYTVDKEKASEGYVSISIKDYTDELQNPSEVLTNENITEEDFDSVYIILEPGLELINNGAFNDGNIVIKEPGFSYMEIYNWRTRKTITVHTNTYTLTKYDTYTFTIYNEANEIIKEAIMAYDVDAPMTTLKGMIDGVEEKVSSSKLYDSVTLKASDDNAIYQIKRVYEDGTIEILKEFEMTADNIYTNTLKFTESGNYKIVLVDKAFNEKTVTFKIK